MKISIITLFEEMFDGPLNHSILKRAQEKKLIEIELVDLRSFGIGSHKTVDDTPYGGGAGMVLRADVLYDAISHTRCKKTCHEKIVLLDPIGKPFTQKKAQELSALDHLILVCGHYEGFDERIRDSIDEEISIGDYVLTGGELPAMVVIDSAVRLIPKVLGNHNSPMDESFSQNLLEYPHYTKPQEFRGKKVPDILLSGNHQEIEKWKKEKALERTKKRRSDLLPRRSTT